MTTPFDKPMKLRFITGNPARNFTEMIKVIKADKLTPPQCVVVLEDSLAERSLLRYSNN